MINRFNEQTVTYGQMNLIFNTRNLWRNMAMWSRAYLISRFAGIGITEDVYKRLLRMTEEFGNTFRLIFGDEIAEKYVQLLAEAVAMFRDLIEAEIAGDAEAANARIKQLYQNGDVRAAFLASINPFWEESQWKNLIYTFYKYSLEEITSFLISDPKNIDMFDQLLHHADTMGDYFSQGLFKYLTYSMQNKKTTY